MFPRGKSYRIYVLSYKLPVNTVQKNHVHHTVKVLMAKRKNIKGIIFSGVRVNFNVIRTYQK